MGLQVKRKTLSSLGLDFQSELLCLDSSIKDCNLQMKIVSFVFQWKENKNIKIKNPNFAEVAALDYIWVRPSPRCTRTCLTKALQFLLLITPTIHDTDFPSRKTFQLPIKDRKREGRTHIDSQEIESLLTAIEAHYALPNFRAFRTMLDKGQSKDIKGS